MDNAKKFNCGLLFPPHDEKYSQKIRMFQGCPTIAVTKGGRIFLGWYGGGTTEPHMDNYCILTYSDDNGKTWSEPIMIIPGSYEKLIHSLDIQLWTSPEGKLYVFYVQDNAKPATPENMANCRPGVLDIGGYLCDDIVHAKWVSVCDNPDSDVLEFSEPKYLFDGFLRCKPTVLSDGRWLLCSYKQESEKYYYHISDDCGKTFKPCYGGNRLKTHCDETMAYEKKDGSIRMLARCNISYHELAESCSYDGGNTWTETKLSGIDNPETRFFVARTPSDRVLLINNDSRETRNNMTIMLSDDDGETWKYKVNIDKRKGVSYPDADFYNGRIYVAYDYDRTGAGEILFASFTEDDIINNREIVPVVVIKNGINRNLEKE